MPTSAEAAARRFTAPAGGSLNPYQTSYNALADEYSAGRMTEEQFNARLDELQKSSFGPKSFDIGEFEGLLSRLEGSKTRQQRAKDVEQRRNIMTTGLANMMSNF